MRIDDFIKKIKQNNFWIIFLGALLAIIAAYFAEFVGKLAPCSLCIFERIPYLMLQCIALLAIIRPNWHKFMSYMVIITGLIEICLAIYHIGIEHYIFNESYICQASEVSCSAVAFKFMNLSMAEWNLVYIIALLYYFIHQERKNGEFTRRP